MTPQTWLYTAWAADCFVANAEFNIDNMVYYVPLWCYTTKNHTYLENKTQTSLTYCNLFLSVRAQVNAQVSYNNLHQ